MIVGGDEAFAISEITDINKLLVPSPADVLTVNFLGNFTLFIFIKICFLSAPSTEVASPKLTIKLLITVNLLAFVSSSTKGLKMESTVFESINKSDNDESSVAESGCHINNIILTNTVPADAGLLNTNLISELRSSSFVPSALAILVIYSVADTSNGTTVDVNVLVSNSAFTRLSMIARTSFLVTDFTFLVGTRLLLVDIDFFSTNLLSYI